MGRAKGRRVGFPDHHEEPDDCWRDDQLCSACFWETKKTLEILLEIYPAKKIEHEPWTHEIGRVLRSSILRFLRVYLGMIFSPNVAQRKVSSHHMTAMGAAAWTLGATENLRKRSSSEAEKAKEKESKDPFFWVRWSCYLSLSVDSIIDYNRLYTNWWQFFFGRIGWTSRIGATYLINYHMSNYCANPFGGYRRSEILSVGRLNPNMNFMVRRHCSLRKKHVILG